MALCLRPGHPRTYGDHHDSHDNDQVFCTLSTRHEHSASVLSAFTHLFAKDLPPVGSVITLQLRSIPQDWWDRKGMMFEEKKKRHFFLKFTV